MKWIATAVAVIALSGCGEPKPDNSMKGVAARIRETLSQPTIDELYAAAKLKPDLIDQKPGRSSFHARFPADDGFIWVVVYGVNAPSASFHEDTIQFSQSGKLESP